MMNQYRKAKHLSILRGLINPITYIGFVILWIVFKMFVSFHDAQVIRNHLCEEGVLTEGVIVQVENIGIRQGGSKNINKYYYTYSTIDTENVYKGIITPSGTDYKNKEYSINDVDRGYYNVGDIIPVTYSPSDPGVHNPIEITPIWVYNHDTFPVLKLLIIPVGLFVIFVGCSFGLEEHERIQIKRYNNCLGIQVNKKPRWAEIFLMIIWTSVWSIGLIEELSQNISRGDYNRAVYIGVFFLIPYILVLHFLLILLYGKKRLMITPYQLIASQVWGLTRSKLVFNRRHVCNIRINRKSIPFFFVFKMRKKTHVISLDYCGVTCDFFGHCDLKEFELDNICDAIVSYFESVPFVWTQFGEATCQSEEKIYEYKYQLPERKGGDPKDLLLEDTLYTEENPKDECQ